MGIESDQLVYDYLSRVGDLAQQRQLPPGDRVRLVSALRGEIERRRATRGEESPAAVRGILGDLGTPDEVVDRAAPETGRRPLPKPRTDTDADTGTRTGEGKADVRVAPRAGSAPGGPGIPAPRPGVSDPERPPSPDGPEEPDWWRTEDAADGIPGFVGGIERPDLFRPPVPEDDEEEEGEPEDEAAPKKRRLLARLLRRRGAVTAPVPEAVEPVAVEAVRPRLSSPFVLLAALLLLGGAVFGSLVALVAGWLLAYASRRLTPGEVKAAVFVVPGLAAATGILWLWGRVQGRWGDPVAPGGEAMGAAVSETWPWVLRGAAVASALFLLWRARRR